MGSGFCVMSRYCPPPWLWWFYHSAMLKLGFFPYSWSIQVWCLCAVARCHWEHKSLWWGWHLCLGLSALCRHLTSSLSCCKGSELCRYYSRATFFLSFFMATLLLWRNTLSFPFTSSKPLSIYPKSWITREEKPASHIGISAFCLCNPPWRQWSTELAIWIGGEKRKNQRKKPWYLNI